MPTTKPTTIAAYVLAEFDAQANHCCVRLNAPWLSTPSTMTNNPATSSSVGQLISRKSLIGLLPALMETIAVITSAARQVGNPKSFFIAEAAVARGHQGEPGRDKFAVPAQLRVLHTALDTFAEVMAK